MIEELIKSLNAHGATVATAESCTGGRVAAALTAAPGASEYFLGGVVAYANEVKIGVLDVSPETLARHGAVSRETARQMALGVQRITGAGYAMATTGIAGPGGGTPEKPVGTVWIAAAGPDGKIAAQEMHFTGSRLEIMAEATEAAIYFLRIFVNS
jgi:PncC family amidohydrolase